MRYAKIFILGISIIVFTAVIVSCSDRDEHEVWQEWDDRQREEQQREDQARETQGGSSHEVGNDIHESNLEGEITILVPFFPTHNTVLNNDLIIYARLFNRHHPNVRINFDTYTYVDSVADQTALTTRLLADPADILFYFPDNVPFEKTKPDTLFVDLYSLFDGPRGIDQSDYFDNLFRAAEYRGGLYHLPFYVSMELVFLNKKLFEGIDVDVSRIETLNIDEEVEYYLRIAEAFPGEAVYANSRSSLLYVLMRESMYDMEAGDVYVDTPAVRSRFERAIGIPMPEGENALVSFTPEGAVIYAMGMDVVMLAGEVALLPSDLMFWDSRDGNLSTAGFMMLSDHPNLQFSQPVALTSVDGRQTRFKTEIAYAVSRQAKNMDLAWEFIRFMMEFEESQYNHGSGGGYVHFSSLPINRNRFENQVGAVIEGMYTDLMSYTNWGLFIDDSGDSYKAQIIASIMDYYRTHMELLNTEIVCNMPVLESLVYPDLWLLYSGQQGIARALANIQNQLELYIAE